MRALYLHKPASKMELDLRRSEMIELRGGRKKEGFLLERLSLPSPSRLNIIRALRRSDPELEHLFHSAMDNESSRK